MQSAGDLSEVVIDQWRQRIRSSTFANYHYEMGLALSRSDDKVGAIERMRKATSLMPEHAAACFELERLLLSTGQALANTDKIDPELRFRGFIEHVARALTEGRFADAEKDLATASHPEKYDAIIKWLLFITLMGKGEAGDKPDTPITDTMALLMRPVGPLLLATGIKLQVAMDPAALDFLRLCLVLEPDNPSYMQWVTTALLVNKHHDELRDHIGRLPRTDVQLLRHRALLWIGLDEAEEALTELDLMQEETPHCMSLVLRACTLLLMGRRDEAEPLIRQAEELGTNPIWIIVARAWYETGGTRSVRLDAGAGGMRFVLARLPARISALLDLQ